MTNKCRQECSRQLCRQNQAKVVPPALLLLLAKLMLRQLTVPGQAAVDEAKMETTIERER